MNIVHWDTFVGCINPQYNLVEYYFVCGFPENYTI